MIPDSSDPPPDERCNAHDARFARRAKALRENLKRRRQQRSTPLTAVEEDEGPDKGRTDEGGPDGCP